MIKPEHLSSFTESVRLVCGLPPEYCSDADLRAELTRVTEILWSYFRLTVESRSEFKADICRLFDVDSEFSDDMDDILDEVQLIFESASAESSPQDDPEVRDHLVMLLDSYRTGTSSDNDLEFESLAEFAEPLICCSRVLENPDLIDEMMMRAHDYWHLALSGKIERNSGLTPIIDKYTQNGDSPADIRSEAMMMIERFDLLYRTNGSRP